MARLACGRGQTQNARSAMPQPWRVQTQVERRRGTLRVELGRSGNVCLNLSAHVALTVVPILKSSPGLGFLLIQDARAALSCERLG